MRAGRWSSWSIRFPLFLDALFTCDESWVYCSDQETEFQVEACWLSQTQEGQTEQIHPQNFDDSFFESIGKIYMTGFPTGQTVNKEYYVEVLREFRKRFRQKRPAFFKSGQWHFHLDNAPVHNSILVTDYLTKMSIKTVHRPPYSPDFAPCNFWLFPKLKENLRGCRYETIEEMKEALTKVINTLTQEDFHGAFQKMLVRYNKCIAAGEDYFEFLVCTINKSAHTKKSLETYCVLHVYIYIYIYIYIFQNYLLGLLLFHISILYKCFEFYIYFRKF